MPEGASDASIIDEGVFHDEGIGVLGLDEIRIANDD